MPLMRWTASSRAAGRNLRVRVGLHDLAGTPIPPPAGPGEIPDTMTVPPDGVPRSASAPASTWRGVRCEVELSDAAQQAHALALVFEPPRPVFAPTDPPPPEVQEIGIQIDPAPVHGSVLATVRIKDGGGSWRPLCDRQLVALEPEGSP